MIVVVLTSGRVENSLPACSTKLCSQRRVFLLQLLASLLLRLLLLLLLLLRLRLRQRRRRWLLTARSWRFGCDPWLYWYSWFRLWLRLRRPILLLADP